MISDASNMSYQPVPVMKRTGPIPGRRKGPSRAASAVPHPTHSAAHTPLDLQPVEDIFNMNTDDTLSIYQYSASEARTPTLPRAGAQKRSSRALGKFGDGDPESSPTRRFRGNDQLPHPASDLLLSRASPALSLPTMSGPLHMVSIPR